MPENLIASTLPKTNGETVDDTADVELNGESRGGTTTSGRRRRGQVAPVKGDGRAHKLTISDDVFERLLFETRKRNKLIDARNRNRREGDPAPRITMSALANAVLDRELPSLSALANDLLDRNPPEVAKK